MTTLECGTCHEEKAVFLFSPHQQRLTQHHCIQCCKARRAKYVIHSIVPPKWALFRKSKFSRRDLDQK